MGYALAAALRTTTPRLWTTVLMTTVLIAEFASATIRVRAAPVFVDDAAGKEHERETTRMHLAAFI
jgi:hypothetical protein